MTNASNSSPNWWMYHGDPEHTGYVGTGSDINSGNVTECLKVHKCIQLDGPILSVPAIVDDSVYVGVANSHDAVGSNGGSLYKIDISSGETVNSFRWNILAADGDTHGFTGMGCTPCIAYSKIYFSAFDGKFYCLDQETLECLWVVDLRHADSSHNQPVTNTTVVVDETHPPAVGWSSPVAANGRVYVGMGEGENPSLFGFVYCMDAETGNIVWIYCTCPFVEGEPNQPNVLPPDVARTGVPEGFAVASSNPLTRGCSVWGSIAYDEGLNRIYCPTGNPQPEPIYTPFNSILPTRGNSNGLLALDADTGEFRGFRQVPEDSNYRPSDYDIDIGGSPTIFTRNGQRVVGVGCKNGCYFVVDADTFKLLGQRQLLPYALDGDRIPTVDPHPLEDLQNEQHPRISNETSNKNQGENYFGVYGAAAIHPNPGRLFIGIGGPNYHSTAPGIDFNSTPFMRVIDWDTLQDAWSLTPNTEHNVMRYSNSEPPMYTTCGESGLSSPAVVNDVVFCSTSKVALHAFDVKDGKHLWTDKLGKQTGGFSGGYGYCLGPAVWKNYVVAGALVSGGDGGILKIYKLQQD